MNWLPLTKLKALIEKYAGLGSIASKEVEIDLSLTNVTPLDFVPAGAQILGVGTRVDEAVVTSGATNTFDVGVSGGDVDAFGAGIAGAAGTEQTEADYTVAPSTLWSAADQQLAIGAPGAETFTSGIVTLKIAYAKAPKLS